MSTSSRAGLFIAVEGIDGAGKTTLVGRLVEFFERAGVEVVRSKEPTDGPWGRKIRESAFAGRHDAAEELRLFTCDRAEHFGQLVGPALAAGKVVVLDRYYYSTAAYQGVAGAPAAAVRAATFDRFPTPDVALLVDVPAEVGVSRIREGRGEVPNRFEDAAYLRDVRTAFLAVIQDRPEVRVLQGAKTADDVAKDAIAILLDGVLRGKFCAKSYGCDAPESCTYRITDSCEWVRLKRAV
jgi:dTMP kinase